MGRTGQTDHVTFDLGGHGGGWWGGALSSTCVRSLQLVGLTIWKIWGILCVRINRSVTLSFDLFDLEAAAEHCTCRAETSYQFWYFYDYSFSSYGPHGSDRPCNLDLWPWRSWRWLVRRGFVLHLYTKFEFRRPYRSEDIRHFVCENYSVCDPDLWPFDVKTGAQYSACRGEPSYQFCCFDGFSFPSYGPTRVRLVTCPCDLGVWPWRTRRLCVT